MGDPLVVIVTPVHNGAEHLARCIESVLEQTYTNWRYLVVDNSSTDDTPRIARSLARTDERVSVVRFEEFLDVIGSFNRAFSLVDRRSRYFKALGSDDWLYPHCLERMVRLAEEHPSVGLVSAHRMKQGMVDLGDLPASTTVVPGREIVALSLRRRVSLTGSPSSVLFRSAFLEQRDPFYDPSFRHADTEVAFWALMRSDFGFVHEVLTFTRTPDRAEGRVSDGLNSHRAERIRMMLRYGPETLPQRDYHRRLRHELREYLWWHLKQRARPSRRNDRAFHTFHGAAISLMRAEGAREPEVRSATVILSTLLGT